MTTFRFISSCLLISLLGCHNQAKQDIPIVPKQPEPSCACEFLTDKPGYDINQNPDSLTRYYLDIWKRNFMQRNEIDETQFAARINYVTGTLFNWQQGVSLRVEYIYHIDWVNIRNSESIQVNYDPVTTKDYAITVPRGVYLTESQLILRLPWADFQPLQFKGKLAFSSCENACQALKTKTGFPMLKPNGLSLYPPPKLPVTETGEPYLFGGGTVDSTANECVFGRINLLTGEAKADKGPCWIR